MEINIHVFIMINSFFMVVELQIAINYQSKQKEITSDIFDVTVTLNNKSFLF